MSFKSTFINKINQLYVDIKINIMFNILIKTRCTNKEPKNDKSSKL